MAYDGGCLGGSDHVWQLQEVLVDETAADLVSACLRCGATGLAGGQGRRGGRPGLPEFPD